VTLILVAGDDDESGSELTDVLPVDRNNREVFLLLLLLPLIVPTALVLVTTSRWTPLIGTPIGLDPAKCLRCTCGTCVTDGAEYGRDEYEDDGIRQNRPPRRLIIVEVAVVVLAVPILVDIIFIVIIVIAMTVRGDGCCSGEDLDRSTRRVHVSHNNQDNMLTVNVYMQ
jgi:hypothetical protein